MQNRHDDVFPWPSLPADLRLLVLEEIISHKHRGWASCAAVCKEWQAVIEPENFRQLALTQYCLDEFEHVVRQRPLVKQIYLNIELPQYDCTGCHQRATMSSRRSTMSRKAILKLFSILSTWKPAGQLMLELNASSPSDSQHWFKNYCFGPGHEDTASWTQQEKAIRWDDPVHRWYGGHQVMHPDVPAILRLFTPLIFNRPKDVPVVRVVTSFRIRRQLRHEVFPEVLKALWEKLPRLESVVYELWRYRRYDCRIPCGYELATLVQDSIPKHVKEVSIFKDFNDSLTWALHNDPLYFGDNTEKTSLAVELALAKAFAAKSDSLERLSISYMIDAQQFFSSCLQLPCHWNLLQSLFLTSSALARTVRRRVIFTLLRDASQAALSMPQLKSMVLWNSEQGHTCAVIYQRQTFTWYETASLTWRGTWDIELSQDVVESWKKVVALGSCDLRVEKELLRDVEIRSHGDAIYYLRLPDGVIDAESLRQIRQEVLR